MTPASQADVVALLEASGGVQLSLTAAHPLVPVLEISPGQDIAVRFEDGSTVIVQTNGEIFPLPQ